MSFSSGSSYYTQSTGQPQNMYFTDYSQNGRDPEDAVNVLPEGFNFDSSDHSHSHNMPLPEPHYDAYEGDPHSTPLRAEHFRNVREHMSAPSPSGSTTMWHNWYLYWIVPIAIALIALMVWYFFLRGGSDRSVAQSSPVGPPIEESGLFGSGALSDLEFL